VFEIDFGWLNLMPQKFTQSEDIHDASIMIIQKG